MQNFHPNEILITLNNNSYSVDSFDKTLVLSNQSVLIDKFVEELNDEM